MNSNIEERTKAFAQTYQPTLVDRFGVWLSGRQIRRWIPSFRGLKIGDFGRGYHASFTRTVLHEVEQAVLIDVSIADDLRESPRVKVITGTLPLALESLPDQSLDGIVCISVLEHLWEPLEAIQEFKRILVPGGICLMNVPSWRGKWFLEYSAYRLQLSPKEEMDDHKMYSDVRDFWPLLVRGGFKPSGIRCFKHKFGLNTFAVCRNL